MMKTTFEMVAKTFQGLEGVLAKELEALGAADIQQGRRMVSFKGDLALLYKANMCCRTALRILKPFRKFTACDTDELYSRTKEYDWSSLMDVNKTFAIDTVTFSDDFHHSQFVTYRVKDAIVDWFRDHLGDGKRPRVCIDGADIMINVHISGREVTLSLDSSGESLHRRGYRKVQNEAPINEVLAAGIIMLSGWDGTVPFVDPMCGSGTFLIEAALIAAGIYPGMFRKHFAFENWPDFDRELLDDIYNDDSADREVTVPIIGADISPRAIEMTRENAKNAGVLRHLTLGVRPIAKWEQASTAPGVLVTNPPYGKRIVADDMNELYRQIGHTLKHVFTGYHAWIIGYTDDYFTEIGLAPSQKIALNNGGLDCELREYVIFEGRKKEFRASGGILKQKRENTTGSTRPSRRHGMSQPLQGRGNNNEVPGERFRRAWDEKKSYAGKGRDSSCRPWAKDRDDSHKPWAKDRDDSHKPWAKDRDDSHKPWEKGHDSSRKPWAKNRYVGRKPWEKNSNEDNKGGKEQEEHRPIDISQLGRQPSIPESKQIILAPDRRVRKRKKDSDLK